MRKSCRWPKNCVWPEPIGAYGGIDWDEDIIPNELDEYTQELVEIKEYFDGLVEAGMLDDEYCLVEDEDFEPEKGLDFWEDDRFDIEAWREELTTALNCIKIDVCDDDPIIAISAVVNYRFINENLLRQAFTRRAFQIEYGLSGCSEELEFLGDSVLSLVITKELSKHFSEVVNSDTEAPFQAKYDEGEFSSIKSSFVCKEHLATRCSELGLDKYILFGTGEERSESAKEDAIEALIGAIAIDCNWNIAVLEDVIDRLIHMQINELEKLLKQSYYDLVNAWHMRKYGFQPVYEVYPSYRRSYLDDNGFDCVIKFCIPENDKGIHTGQTIIQEGATRSKARELAAEFAYRFIVSNGLWMNLKDANVVPDYEKAINQLQELFQKKYIEKPEYEFTQEADKWICQCVVSGIRSNGKGSGKTEAKKKAAYEAVVQLLRAAGCCKDGWYSQMLHTLYSIEALVDTPKEEKKPVGGVKYEALVDILNQVEAGKVITEKVLLDWLGKKYGVENLQINWQEIPNIVSRKEDAPWHRFLTAKGLVHGYYMDRVAAEGHQVVETKTDNCRVLDYKESMVDVNRLTVPNHAIGPCGHFLDHVRDELKKGVGEKSRGFFTESVLTPC